MTTKQLDKQTLNKIAYKNETAKDVFLALASRERSRPETDLRRFKSVLLKEGFKIVPDEFTATFKELANTGVGEFVHKPGQPPRFRWHFNLITIGVLGLGEDKASEKISLIKKNSPPRMVDRRKPVEREFMAEKPVQVINLASNTVVAMLTNNRSAKMEIPQDISKEEAKLLADTILRQVQ